MGTQSASKYCKTTSQTQNRIVRTSKATGRPGDKSKNISCQRAAKIKHQQARVRQFAITTKLQKSATSTNRATRRRRMAKTPKVQQYPSKSTASLTIYVSLTTLTQSKQRRCQPMDTYTTALFLKTQTKTRNGFEQRQLEPKGCGGTRFLNGSVGYTTRNKNQVFM